MNTFGRITIRKKPWKEFKDKTVIEEPIIQNEKIERKIYLSSGRKDENASHSHLLEEKKPPRKIKGGSVLLNLDFNKEKGLDYIKKKIDVRSTSFSGRKDKSKDELKNIYFVI